MVLNGDVLRKELSIVREVKKFLDASDSIYVDAANFVGQRFLSAVIDGEEFRVLLPWDHHPGPDGYVAYAEAAIELVKRMED